MFSLCGIDMAAVGCGGQKLLKYTHMGNMYKVYSRIYSNSFFIYKIII